MSDKIWKLVDAVLDERGDPFADPELAARLAEEPHVRAQIERLSARLEALRTLPSSVEAPEPRRTRRLRPTLAVSAAAALVLFALVAWRDRSEVDASEIPMPSAPLASVELVVETLRTDPAAAVGRRVVLERQRILSWNLETR